MYGWSIFILCRDCKKGRESEHNVKCVSIESFICSKASWIAFSSAVNTVSSFGSRTENNRSSSNFIFIFLPSELNSIAGYVDCFISGNFYFVSVISYSDTNILTSGLINSHGDLRGRLESSTCFPTLKLIDFKHILLLSYRLSEKSWWKTLQYAGLSIFALSWTMFCSVSLSLRKSRSGSFASTYRLPTAEVRKTPRNNRSPWWWNVKS